MGTNQSAKATTGISDAAVRAATGKKWREWFRLLDKAGGRKMHHREIVAYLGGQPDLNGWWRQMVTVGYERARGKRAKHQKADGFQVSRSKTVPVSLARLYQAWATRRIRNQWLPGDPLTIRKATRNKSLRATWSDGKTSVEAYFHNKGKNKSTVTVQHGKLPNAEAAEHMKVFWGQRLEALRSALAG